MEKSIASAALPIAPQPEICRRPQRGLDAVKHGERQADRREQTGKDRDALPERGAPTFQAVADLQAQD